MQRRDDQSAIKRFNDIVFRDFSLAFIGIGLTRFWYQYNLYNLHFSADDGFGTVSGNLPRVAFILILLLITWDHELPQKARNSLVWVSLALMTLGSILYFLELITGDESFELLRYISIGVGLVWGAGMWMDFFVRLKPTRAFLYLAMGLALSCLLSLIGGYLTPYVMALANLFIPTFAVLAYWYAMRTLDTRERMDPPEPQTDFRYTERYHGDVVQIAVALVIFAFVMGMALGFPDGRMRLLTQTVRTIHQLLIVVLLMLVVWFTIARGWRFSFTAVWYFENLLMIASILLLMSEMASAFDVSAFILTNAETCFYTFVFFTCYAIGRRSRRHAMWILGVIYGGTLLAMSLGRATTYAMSLLPMETNIPQLLIMSCLVVVEMVLALRPDLMRELPLFSEVNPLHGVIPSREGISAEVAPTGPVAIERDPVDARIEELRRTSNLTDTEVQIARLIVHGRSRPIIAQELGYSENTIRNYTRSLYQKLGIHSKQQLIDAVGE